MHAVIRHYEGIDSTRLEELIGIMKDDFIPNTFSEIEGVNAYHVIDSGTGLLTTIGIFDTAEAAEESTQVAANYIREQGLADVLPNPPQVITGEIVAQHTAIKTR
jgi:hypothetical protein